MPYVVTSALDGSSNFSSEVIITLLQALALLKRVNDDLDVAAQILSDLAVY